MKLKKKERREGLLFTCTYSRLYQRHPINFHPWTISGKREDIEWHGGGGIPYVSCRIIKYWHAYFVHGGYFRWRRTSVPRWMGTALIIQQTIFRFSLNVFHSGPSLFAGATPRFFPFARNVSPLSSLKSAYWKHREWNLFNHFFILSNWNLTLPRYPKMLNTTSVLRLSVGHLKPISRPCNLARTQDVPKKERKQKMASYMVEGPRTVVIVAVSASRVPSITSIQNSFHRSPECL